MGNVVSVAIRAQGVNQTNQAIDSVGTHLDGLNKTVSVIGAGVGALGVAFLGATTMFARGAFQAATAMAKSAPAAVLCRHARKPLPHRGLRRPVRLPGRAGVISYAIAPLFA